jgi:hypothetical protein
MGTFFLSDQKVAGKMGRVEADARGPPSQLQEALKKSTKVDAKYNMPTRAPKTRVNMTKRRIPGVDHMLTTCLTHYSYCDYH